MYSALSIAQDKNYAREIIDTLTSPSMFGRGYVNKGDQIAANYIASQFKKFGLKKFDDNYLQNFNMAINTFPDTIEVDIDQEKLVPGKDYVLFSSSPGVSGTFDLIRTLADSSGKLRFLYDDFSNKVIVTNIDQREFKKYDSLNPKGVIFLMDKRVQWHVSDGGKINEYFQMQVLKEKISTNAKTISIHAKNKFYKNYQTQNVIGFIEGKVQPDSFFVFTAHYDHLGQMGAEVYFPGANDNASGTAT
ncbi:MAG: aminopeptidase, partial [Deltaproteobacteria bacterium]